MIEDDELPWPIEIRYVHYSEDKDAPAEWRCVGLEIKRSDGPRSPSLDAPPEPGRETTAIVSPADLGRLSQRWAQYVTLGQTALSFILDPAAAEAVAMRSKGRGRRGLSPEFLSRIAEEYNGLVGQGRPAIAELARAHKVNKSTASRWISKARELELVKED